MQTDFLSSLPMYGRQREHDYLKRILPSAGVALLMMGLLFSLALSARAQTVASLTFSPSTIISGSETMLTVTLSSAAPAGGAPITITQNGTTYGTTFVSPGQSSVTISWEWFESQSAAVSFVAQSNNTSATGVLNVTYAPWTSVGLGVASDGTGRVLAVRGDGTAGIWVFGGNDDQTAFGPTYAHTAARQGTWSAIAVATASDDSSRVLWTLPDGSLNLWSISSGTNQIGPTYGPYSDSGGTWAPKSVAIAGDGTSRVLWARSDGAAGLWSLDETGTLTQIGPTYGPYAGWTAKAVGAASDGTSRVLWTRSDGTAGLWSFGANDTETVIGPAYGPYSSSAGNWSAKAIAVAHDGTSRVLWDRSDGAAGVWSFAANDTETVVGLIYGPYLDANGLWTAGAVAASPDGTARVLWTRPSGQAGLWSFGTNDAETVIGSAYGPF